jgi:hypothetical protein
MDEFDEGLFILFSSACTQCLVEMKKMLVSIRLIEEEID